MWVAVLLHFRVVVIRAPRELEVSGQKGRKMAILRSLRVIAFNSEMVTRQFT